MGFVVRGRRARLVTLALLDLVLVLVLVLVGLAAVLAVLFGRS
ncbi:MULTISPECIES: hypothetical protein [unclassified Curtobacterium]